MNQTAARRSMYMYVAGFILSLALTLSAYALVVRPALSHSVIIVGIVALAVVQFVVQLVFFLHIGTETKPRWKLFVLLFMLLVIGILVAGSLWIMASLNYRMSPQQMNDYLKSQDGL